MQQYSTEWPTLKELEARLFRMLQEQFAAALARMLEAIDEGLMRQRDHVGFRLKDVRPIQLETSVGTVRFRRRLYQDRTNGEYVFLLDRTLGFEGQRKISPFLEDVAVELAAQGPSYRKSAACLASWLGYRVMSHETIRRRLITRAEQEAKHAVETVERKPVRVLFVEADGLHVSLQRSRRKSVEHRMAVVHEGWEREGQRVRLKRKRHYIHTGSGEFWEGFGDFLLRYYDMDEQTWLVVNGDGAEWIGECESYFIGVSIRWTGFMWRGRCGVFCNRSRRPGARHGGRWRRGMRTGCWRWWRPCRRSGFRTGGERNGRPTALICGVTGRIWSTIGRFCKQPGSIQRG